MISDSLTHVTPDGHWFGTGCNASEEELLRQLDEVQAELAVVVALAGHIENSFVLNLCQRHPDRLVPCASFNPVAHSGIKKAIIELRAELRESPYRALKLHPRLNRYDPLDPRCLAVLEELASWGRPLPIWLDTLFYFRGAQLRKPPVDSIHQLVGQFPDLQFVLLHGGGSWMLHLAEAIRDCPNAFMDISFTLQRYASSSMVSDLRYVLSSFDQRVIFGSDFPEIGIPTALETFRRVAEGIPAEKCTNVLGSNLLKILGKKPS
jgi:predicted TIM-barrel fold metal-dependent hydrolase